MSGRLRITLALGLAAAAAMAVVAALLTIGGPGTGRLERLDARRAGDLAELAHAIEHHRAVAGQLPDSLDALVGQVVEDSGTPPGRPHLRDPQTGERYGYEVLGDARFRVCARLSLPGSPSRADRFRSAASHRIARVVPDPDGNRLCLEPAAPPE